MRRVRTAVLPLLCAALAGPAPTRHIGHAHSWSEITLEIESLEAGPVTTRVVVETAPPATLGKRARADSTTGLTPLLIPLDSAAQVIRVTTVHDRAVRLRVRAGGRDLQQPSLAWGRDLELRRAGDHYDVVARPILITPR